MTTARVAFSGIDGAGKTTLIARIRARLVEYGSTNVAVTKNDRHETRREIATRFAFAAPSAYLDGFPAAWYALASSLDFLRYAREIPGTDPGSSGILLLDRYVDDFVAYARTVTPSCGSLVQALLAELPPVDLTVHVVTRPDLAWARIHRDGARQVHDESPQLLGRYAVELDALLRSRSDVVRIDNAGALECAVDGVLDAFADQGLIKPPTTTGGAR